MQQAKAKLTDLRQQVLDAVQHAQAIAQGGASGAVALATSTLQSTLAGAAARRSTSVLASFGLKLPENVATPVAPTTAPSAPSLPTTVLAPVQSILNGVDSLLSQLLGRRAG